MARGRLLGALLAPALLSLAPGARCQVAVSGTLTSDELYRGISLSDGQPALEVSLVYDQKSGVYAGGALIGDLTRRRGARFLGDQAYVGYARRLGGGTTLDVGLSNLHYRNDRYPFGGADATEVYAGWAKGSLNAYVHYSPNYFHPGRRAVYGEVNGVVRLPRPLRLFGHAGVLTPLGGGYERYDLRVGIAAAFRRGEAQLAWSAARPAIYVVPPSPAYGAPPPAPAVLGRGVVALGLTWFF